MHLCTSASHTDSTSTQNCAAVNPLDQQRVSVALLRIIAGSCVLCLPKKGSLGVLHKIEQIPAV